MLRIALFTILVMLSCEGLAQRKAPPTMEQINAALKAKKEALEPFNDKDVKVDLESLGLDDVDKKPAAAAAVEAAPTLDLPKTAEEKPVKKAPKLELVEPKPQPVVAAESKGEAAESGGNFTNKISNFLHKGEERIKSVVAPTQEPVVAPVAEVKVEPKKNTQKYVNSAKKKNLKKRLEAEKRQRIYEKNKAHKAKELQELRAKYLIKIEKTDLDFSQKTAENFAEDEEEKILPQKKNLNRFVLEEPPALPIIDRYRTSDNLHIPIILTRQERINILFDAIASGNVAFFTSAYKDIEEPNVKNSTGDTILTYAILLQKYPVMAAVLARGANPNMTNDLGYSPLDIAVELLDIKALEILVKNKADIFEVDGFGRTSLMHAARVGFLPAAELFVLEGVDVNTMDNDGFTALSIAYRHKKEVIVKFLLKSGAKTWIEKPYSPEKKTMIEELENRWQ
ncbi:MAG: ankyrin repeat domain-containing protein [Rickettsiales bacterium]|nr:ankyrin repeat domain-containing protein [Rickettsiales bacterium]